MPLISTNCRHRRTDINIRPIDIIPVTRRDRSASKPIDRNFGGAHETNGGLMKMMDVLYISSFRMESVR